MKELSIKQKAQRYDSNYEVYTGLINRLEDVKNAIKKQNYGIAMDILCKPYPQFQVITHSELKESEGSEDERIRKIIKQSLESYFDGKLSIGTNDVDYAICLSWLRKQGEKESNKIPIWKHWKNGVAGNEGDKLIYLVKMNDTYRLTSALAFECDYIELLELDNLMIEKQGEHNSTKIQFTPEQANILNKHIDKAVEKNSDWSEKCGEQNPYKVESKFKQGDTIREKETGNLFYVNSIEDFGYTLHYSNCPAKGCTMSFKYEDNYELVEHNPADKVEQKFKVKKGKWYVCTNTFVSRGKIIAIKGQTYQSQQEDDTITCEDKCLFIDRHDGKASDYFRPWTIQDAKDGDVLCYKDEISLYRHDIKNCTKQETTFGGFVYYCCYDGKRFVVNSLYSITEQDKMDIHPATKEQRDQLEKAIADAGYEWDAEHRQLRKIESRQEELTEFEKAVKQVMEEAIECGDTHNLKADADMLLRLVQKSSWSEEDNKMLRFIGNAITVNDASIYLESKGIQVIDAHVWLEELKERIQPQNRWKQENTGNLTDFENAMMHIGDSFFGQYEGLDPNDTNAIKEQANLLLELVPSKEWSE